MAGYLKELNRTRVIWQDATLVASGASVNSGYIRLPQPGFLVTKTHTTGTYTMTIDWSLDGTNLAFTETVALSNATPVQKTAAAPYAKFTVAATVASFTVHQTIVMATTTD